MSSSRIVFLVTGLVGLVWFAADTQAQVANYVSPTKRVRAMQGELGRGTAPSERLTKSLQGPAAGDRHEPAPLRKEGFIQQLRALPQTSVQALQEAEIRQLRLPPTYSGLRDRRASNYPSVEQWAHFPSRPGDRDGSRGAGQALQTAFVESAQQGSTERYSQEEEPESIAVRFAAERTAGEHFDKHPDRQAIERRPLGPELESSEDSRGITTVALTPESLQQAPRVSRVPLPRPAATQSDPLATLPPEEDTAAPPARIVATPTSSVPHRGSLRISTATLHGATRDVPDDGGSENSPSLSLPDLPLPAMPLPALPDSQLPPMGDSQSVAPPNAVPSPTIASDSALADKEPAAEESAELPYSKVESLRDSSSETEERLLPNPGPTSLGITLPTAPPTMGMTTIGTTGPTTTKRSPAATGQSMPQLALESKQASAPLASLGSPDRRLKMEAPHLVVLLNGPSDLPIGTPAPYEIVVRNDDSIDLHGLILRMDIPGGVKVQALKPTHGQFEIENAANGLTMVTWSFDHLPAGQTASAPMQLVASSAQNFAVAMEWTLMPIAGTSAVEVRTPRLELSLDGPAEVRFGEANTYRLHIRNPGTAVANHLVVRLSAEPYGSSSAEIERIAPGEEEIIEVELTFNERGAINIAAVAEEESGLTGKTAIDVLVRQAIVQAQLLATPLVYHGTPTECGVRLTNSGDADALDLRVALQLPEGAGLVSAPPGALLSGRELTWRVDQLDAGGSELYTVQLKLTGEGSNSLALQCSGPGNVSSSATAVTRVESITDLKLFVNDPIAPAPVGSEVVYELTLTNRGSKAATNVKVIAQFSDGIEPTHGEGHTARVVPGQALFEPLPRLAAGETVKLKVFAKAAASGIHRFRVEVRSDESEVRLVQEESTQYLESLNHLAAPISADSTLR